MNQTKATEDTFEQTDYERERERASEISSLAKRDKQMQENKTRKGGGGKTHPNLCDNYKIWSL